MKACSTFTLAAVSKVLNVRPEISTKRAEFVRKTVQEMGCCANSAAQMLKTNRSHNIGILFENRLAHEFFSIMLEEIRDTVEAICDSRQIP